MVGSGYWLPLKRLLDLLASFHCFSVAPSCISRDFVILDPFLCVKVVGGSLRKQRNFEVNVD